MNRMIHGAAGLSGPLALSALLVATAPPAAAASTPVNQSYALNAVGHFSAQMIGQATYSGGSPVVLPNADTAGILRTGIITDSAGAVSASSQIPALSVVLPAHGSLRAAAVSSSCSFNRKTGVVTGHSRITGGRITRPGGRPVTLPATAAPNTRMVIPGLAVIILNRQYTGPAGTLTAEALRVRMLRGHRQRLVFATSVCVKADMAATPPVNDRTMRLTLGGLGLLVLGGIAYQLTRRRRKLAAPV
ncbi:MAG: choice-of-anchor P family protein [Streptosporangiaceae bacterium]